MASKSFTEIVGNASKSLTAITSVVSVVRDKTMVAFRCNTRGCERVLYPMIAAVLLALALACLAVAVGTPVWVEVEVRSENNEDRGHVTFGLFRGSHDVQLIAPTRREESYRISKRYTGKEGNFSGIPLARVNATIAFDCIAMVLCIVTTVFTILNSYQTVKTWWKGPPMMYILSFSTALSGLIALGIFLDFYLWDVDGDTVLVQSLRGFQNLLNAGYTTELTLGYSFGLQVAGGVVPLLVLLLSWRLAVLVPVVRSEEQTNGNGFAMEAPPSMYGGSSSAREHIAVSEREGVLY